MLVVRGPATLHCYDPTIDVEVTGRVVRVDIVSDNADRPCNEESWLTHYEAHVEGLAPGLWEVHVRTFMHPAARRTVHIE